MGDNKKVILVVDDTPINLKNAQLLLQDHYQVVIAKSGRLALQYLEKHIPDLILLDIFMPDMDGFETFECMKKSGNLSDIPVMFLTADLSRECELKGFRMGAMDFITKPFIPEIMLSRIERILQLYELKNDLMEQVAKKTVESQKDNLTGLWNRGYVEVEVNRFLNTDGNRGVLFILDLDNFKSINDTYGHITGDAVLLRFSDILNQMIRGEDIASRIGGDEFILFFKGKMSHEMAEEKANKIIDSFRTNLQEIHTGEPQAGISIGIAMAVSDHLSFKKLYQNADRALYYVKQNGKCGYHFYSDEEESLLENPPSSTTWMDMDQLLSCIDEKDVGSGAFQLAYEGFRDIYQFINRSIERTRQNVQVALITLTSFRESQISVEEMYDSMSVLGNAISDSLRKGDVATKFSSSQHVVLLLDTTTENGRNVIERILTKYLVSNSNQMIKATFDIRELKKKN